MTSAFRCETPGFAWRPLAAGRKSASRRDCFVYTMHGRDAAHPTVKALRTERYKLILSLNPRDQPELYDLNNDPREMKNLASGGDKALMADLKGKLLGEMTKLEDPAVPDVEAAQI